MAPASWKLPSRKEAINCIVRYSPGRVQVTSNHKQFKVVVLEGGNDKQVKRVSQVTTLEGSNGKWVKLVKRVTTLERFKNLYSRLKNWSMQSVLTICKQLARSYGTAVKWSDVSSYQK